MAKRKKSTIKITRISDGDTKEVLKSDVNKYHKQGYKAEWVSTQSVDAVVKDELTEEEKEERKAKRAARRKERIENNNKKEE